MLDACRDLAIVRMSEDLAQTLALVVGELSERANSESSATSPELLSLLTESGALARDKNILIAATFKRRFLARFKEGVRPARNDIDEPERDLTRLNLREPNDLEDFLAIQHIASVITYFCQDELFGLSKRFAILLNVPNLKHEQLPLSPEVIGDALLSALKSQQASLKMRLLLVSHISKYYPAKVCGTYQALNRYLIEQKIVPVLSDSTKRTAAAPALKAVLAPAVVSAPPPVVTMPAPAAAAKPIQPTATPKPAQAKPVQAKPAQAKPTPAPSPSPSPLPIKTAASASSSPTAAPAFATASTTAFTTTPASTTPTAFATAFTITPASTSTPAAFNVVVDASRQDMLIMMQQLMSFELGGGSTGFPAWPDSLTLPGRILAIDAAPNPTNPSNKQSINPATLQIFTRIQQGYLEGLNLGNLKPVHIADGRINILRELKNLRSTGVLSQLETMLLDIVVRLFDYILDDKRLPEPIKAQIGRLQIPILKVAMLDKAFFAQKMQSAHRLLDLIAEAGWGWDATDVLDIKLQKKIDQIVQRIVGQFNDDLALFAEALTDYESYSAQEKQLSDELTARSAQFLRQREHSEMAQYAAHKATLTSLHNKQVPAPIRDFLLENWEKRLIYTDLKYGANSKEWQECVGTMNDLLWSLTPKTDKDERRQLIELLPRLLKRLDSGINELNIDKSIRDVFFSDLVKCHAVAVKAGFNENVEVTEKMSDKPPEISLPPLPTNELIDFEVLPSLPSSISLDPALLAEIAATQDTFSDIEEITIGGVRGEAWDEPRDSHFESLVKDLKCGVWIEFKQDDDSILRARLAWISPLQNTYLLTNRQGQRAVAINAQGLTNKFRDGRAQIIDNQPLIDRAVNNVFEYFLRGA